jgi:hypothetical protein
MTSTRQCCRCRTAASRVAQERDALFLRHPSDGTKFREIRGKISIIRPLSSWGTPSLPWITYQESPVDLEMLKKQQLVRRKWQKLEASLHVVLRKHFQETAFPKEFAIQSRHDLWSSVIPKNPYVSSNTSTSSQASPSPPKIAHTLSAAAKTLMALNGFEQVPLPKSKDVLDLAEGVIVTPAPPKEFKQYLLFSQPAQQEKVPSSGDSTNKTKSSKTTNDKNKRRREYPVFLEEDFTIYRILENQAAIFLDHQYNAYRKFVEQYIDGPSKKLAAQIEASGLLHVFLDLPPEKPKSKRPEIRDDPVETIRHLNPSPAPGRVKRKEPLENLLVMSYDNDDVVLYEQMSPSVRITTLPHIMRHSSASTMVHVSLVVFGALPLAYRSYNFALNYPGLSQTIAASVAFTITYGIWSHRVAAQTNQSRVVANALLHRVHARDDAVVFALQEGAVRHVTGAVLYEYYQRWIDNGSREARLVGSSLTPKLRAINYNGEVDLIKPDEFAIKLGFLVPNKHSDVNNLNGSSCTPVSLDQALAALDSFGLQNKSEPRSGFGQAIGRQSLRI